MSESGIIRCGWAKGDILQKYHDEEWGTPVHDDRLLFEFLILEGAQAGLSWETVLKKRENYRRLFDNFDPEKIVRYDSNKINELLNDSGIIRNRQKIEATVTNAQMFFKIKEQFGSFDAYIWGFVDGETIQNSWKNSNEIPATTKESDNMSKDLKKKGFKFVGSTICYAYMQAVGMVNDHTADCFRYDEILKMTKNL